MDDSRGQGTTASTVAHDSHNGGEWHGSPGDRAVNKTGTVPLPSRCIILPSRDSPLPPNLNTDESRGLTVCATGNREDADSTYRRLLALSLRFSRDVGSGGAKPSRARPPARPWSP